MEGGMVMNIYETIAAVMGEIGAVGKNSKNQQQGFMFRGIDAVMNALSPALIKYKLFVVPEILEQTREERLNSKGTTLIYSICKIKYTFYAEDGSSVSAVVIGEGMDTGDKATNKAMSIAFKYACFQVFCIPTEEMIDPDAEVHEVVKKGAKKEPPKEAPKEEDGPDPNQLINPIMLRSLQARCKHDNVSENLIVTLYKVKTLDQLTLRMMENLTNNWEQIKGMANK